MKYSSEQQLYDREDCTVNTDNIQDDVEVFTNVITSLKRLDPEGRKRVFDAVATFLGLERRTGSTATIAWADKPATALPESGSFSEDRSLSPKDFMMQKQPRTDVERIACLAYYLTHYRDTPYLKTLDLNKLNTEAAQVKLSNAAYAVNNASKLGYLVPAANGHKQLSAVGEQFVQALPDRDAARLAMTNARKKRRARKQNSKKPTEG
jgi:hypothetical protein